MTTATVPLSLPPCPGCAGGGEVNGLPCRECGGKGRQAARLARVRWRALSRRWSLAAAGAAGTLVRWTGAVPGVAGAAGVTIGAAMIIHGVFPRVPELGVAALVAGTFGLLADRRL